MNRRDLIKLFGGAASLPALQAIKSVESLQAGPEDVVVVKLNGRPGAEVMDSVRGEFQKHLPQLKGRTVFIDSSIDISVLRRTT